MNKINFKVNTFILFNNFKSPTSSTDYNYFCRYHNVKKINNFYKYYLFYI